MKCAADTKKEPKAPTVIENNEMDFDFTDRSSVMTG
jgi:hypothetical protein